MKRLAYVLTISSLLGGVCVLVGFSFQNNLFLHGFLIIGICILLGIEVKTMDQLIDDETMKPYRLGILPLAILIPSSMVYLALTEGPVIGMVIGTVIGLLITKKLDHPAYIASVILFIVSVLSASALQVITIERTTFYIIPVAAAGSFLDEYGHERWKSNKKSVTFILQHRFFLKIFAFFGVVLGFALPIHFIGFLCFDIFYDLIDTASQSNPLKNDSFSVRTSEPDWNERDVT